jgi:hypothetical protein
MNHAIVYKDCPRMAKKSQIREGGLIVHPFPPKRPVVKKSIALTTETRRHRAKALLFSSQGLGVSVVRSLNRDSGLGVRS